MEAKLRQLMKHEGINSTRLAEILGIQASGISHIMSGRNKPSFDFLHKLLQRFPQINPDWLLLDKGPMYRDEIKTKGQTPSTGTGVRAGGTATGATAPGGIHGGVTQGGTQSVVGGFTVGGGMAERMLFGPDNDDIIRSDGHGRTDTPHDQDYRSPTGGHYSAGGNPGRNQAMPSGVNPPFHPTQQAEMQPWRTGPEAQSQAGVHIDPQTTQPHVQESVYQSDKFTRSASIERIVVFYKDKTFSEYQPV